MSDLYAGGAYQAAMQEQMAKKQRLAMMAQKLGQAPAMQGGAAPMSPGVPDIGSQSASAIPSISPGQARQMADMLKRPSQPDDPFGGAGYTPPATGPNNPPGEKASPGLWARIGNYFNGG